MPNPLPGTSISNVPSSLPMAMYNTMSRRITLGLATTALTFGVVACGDDDDGASDTTASSAATEATPTTAATDTTEEVTDTSGGETAGAGDVEAFCEAELEAEAASQGDDPSQAEPAFEAFVAAAPEDIREAAEALVAAVQAETFGPEFEEPYAEVIQFMKDNCGFSEMDVTRSRLLLHRRTDGVRGRPGHHHAGQHRRGAP